MVSMLTLSVVGHGFKFLSDSGQTKHYMIVIGWFSPKHAALRRKSKDWLAQNNVLEWSDMSTRGLLFQWASTIKIQIQACWSSTKGTSLSSHWKLTCSLYDIIDELALNNNHSLP